MNKGVRWGRLLTLAVLSGSVLIFFSACTPAPIYTGTRGEVPAKRSSHEGGSSRTSAADQVPGEESPDSFRVGQTLYGVASYYGPKFHGKQTANGETFDQNAMTCAHKTLPFGTTLRVTLMSTGKSVVVRVNDRGPYKKGRIIDLSREAARKVGLLAEGTGMVSAEIITLGGQ